MPDAERTSIQVKCDIRGFFVFFFFLRVLISICTDIHVYSRSFLSPYVYTKSPLFANWMYEINKVVLLWMQGENKKKKKTKNLQNSSTT